MKTLVNRAVLVVSVVLGLSAVALGQPAPDAGIWGGGVANPSGDSAVPARYLRSNDRSHVSGYGGLESNGRDHQWNHDRCR